MGIFTVGDVVLVPFPYSDFKNFKKRPALVVSKAEFNNLILCQITSKLAVSKSAIPLTSTDFKSGSLPTDSLVRPDKLFTIDPNIVQANLGKLKNQSLNTIKASIRKLFE